jgi:Helix-turn-helix domain
MSFAENLEIRIGEEDWPRLQAVLREAILNSCVDKEFLRRSWVPLDIRLGHHLCPAQEPTPMPNPLNPSERGRFSAPPKAATVLRLLRGESLEVLSRELGVTAATLAGWRDNFLAGGQAALKSRPADDRDEEIARLRAKVGELTMDNELLLQRCRGGHPFVLRRRKK